mmetsp:Transcript_5928/g.8976  ORF Transcript_5928/g.8976 Transcript_5928/m.8976 type:complete len:821 (+) Transcript_5928:131-2593(+)|eukprot:CAMPEP_0117011212 /NCGR_PEP_ID=MMETSP0472-20121206/9689_1 /TAXON_ID=693140 ORGANISM="Tiarina fusus, Strain LIS" /NCGR_SAMPLE_ID=MMETSP0472 /ASSEMBLY_ACC=CAM_ASM_000603 /LENGTH=820 /DNA_ID=CAMNT_0004713949 /DNA_START=107 /DNA_END=2569 /DNA_ORIENTATION=+
MDFDENRLYYSHQQLQRQEERPEDDSRDRDPDGALEESVDLKAVRRHFREFLRNYRQATQRYIYREKLLRMHRRLTTEDGDNVVNASNNSALLEVDVAHLGEYDGSLLGYLREQPATILPTLELAASDALDTLLYDLRKENTSGDNVDPDNDGANDHQMEDNHSKNNDHRMAIQLLLKGNLAMTPLRSIKSEHVNRLIRCPGIVISASPVRSRGIRLIVRCSRCSDQQTVMATDGPFGTVTLPTRCDKSAECGSNPYSVVPDESQFCDRQTLKLQEAPEKVPTGEMPRSVMVAVERSLVDRAPPGTRVSIFCIPMIFSSANNSSTGARSLYLRVIGLTKDHQAGDSAQFTPAEEEAFSQLARRRDVYDILTRSVAPSISGSYTVDIKKALICMLMGGTRKRLPDGLRLRGDINVLLLGDPSTAKSQFLKFVSRTSPIGIYTSGKGSSAAGLTASVVRDSKGEFYLEGGAMVLADGGIVCIDEFDKMRPADRVAIHEAMEQQTISIAKAGITTVLNSRSAVLAAANPVYGRYDDFKSASENIDLMTTILSRFDLIFLVRDVREEERDRMICRHVMGVHINNSGMGSRSPGDAGLGFLAETMGEAEGTPRSNMQTNSPEAIAENIMRVATTGIGELDVPSMKKYIQYCKAKCKPVLSEEAGQVLTSSYVKIRDDVRKQTIQSQGGNASAQPVIPITVRQLEALVRVAESLAKTRLDSKVRIEDVDEALRLFRVSTMAASAADQSMGEKSMLASAGNREEIDRAQSFLRSRLAVGSMVNKQKIIEEACGQGYNAMVVARVVSVMAMRGELLEKNQGRLLKRIK